MPPLSNINRWLRLALVILFFQVATAGFGDTLYEVQTGNNKSASWQFTNQLSAVWKLKYQNKSDIFVPRYVDGFHNRLLNLNNQYSKLAIAPLNSIEKLPIAETKIKIAVVLWNVYLLPIDSLNLSKEINLLTNQTWILPENSLIIPAFLNSLRSVYQNTPSELSSELIDLVQSIVWMPQTEETVMNNPQAFSVPIGSTAGTHPEKREAIVATNKLKLTPTNSFLEEINKGSQGLILYEMIGPHTHFTNLLNSNLGPTSLDNTSISTLLKFNWFLNPYKISRTNIQTVGVTYALFVHESEDPEFVRDLIQVLASPPQSYFPKPYLLDNLSINQTKEVSPIFLHEATRNFFKVD